jgi:hypothetical protein
MAQIHRLTHAGLAEQYQRSAADGGSRDESLNQP